MMKNIKFQVSDKKGNYTTIKISEIGRLNTFDNKKKVYSFLVECDKEKESIHFIYYNSIHFTEQREKLKQKFRYTLGMTKEQIEDLIYGILCCINLDYNTEDTNLMEFIGNYGYEYNEETENLFYRVKEQKVKLHKVFTEEQINFFDENDDKLKNYVASLDYQKDVKDLI